MAVAVERSGLKSAPTGPDEALDFAAPFTFLSEKKIKRIMFSKRFRERALLNCIGMSCTNKSTSR